MQEAQYNQELLSFLAHATSPFHAVREISERLCAAGYRQLFDAEQWDLQAGGKY